MQSYVPFIFLLTTLWVSFCFVLLCFLFVCLISLLSIFSLAQLRLPWFRCHHLSSLLSLLAQLMYNCFYFHSAQSLFFSTLLNLLSSCINCFLWHYSSDSWTILLLTPQFYYSLSFSQSLLSFYILPSQKSNSQLTL